MANPSKRRRTRAGNSHRRSRKSNPFRIKRMFHRLRHSRRFKPMGGFSSKELLTLALGAGAGVVASKYVTQLALGDNNSGVMGYAGTAVIVVGLGWAAKKFVGPGMATGVVAGGLGALAVRIFQENISGTSAAAQVSGLGDPDMAALGIGMGEYRAGMIPIPAPFASIAPALPAPANARGARGR